MGTPTLPNPPITTPVLTGGVFSSPWSRWFQLVQTILTGSLHPTTPTGLSQVGSVYQGSGVPANGAGSNGDVYFRTDTPGTANQRMYIKAAGAWTGIL